MTFSPVPINTTSTSLDPSKHVNYTLGMVLGVDDLNQDFAYLNNRDQWTIRDLIGYGTACGLRVTSDKSDVNKGPGITVSPGVAVNPLGQFIRVTPAQCAYLNAWLNSTKISPTVAAHLDESKSTTIYVKLCYRDCLTDSVPVPGEACRTEESGDLLVPSRVQDDFSLDFSFDSIEQAEEDGLRLFTGWMRQVKIAAPGTELDKFLTALRDAASQKFASAPDAGLALDADHITETLRAAFLVWTTEIRPGLRGKDADCVTPSSQDCVMLAAIHFKTTGSDQTGWAVSGSVSVDETKRPYLLHLRMLQEWLLTASSKPLVPDDTLLVTEKGYGQPAAPGKSDHYARADHTHGSPPPVELPSPDDKARVDEITYDQKPDSGKSEHFSRADHTHGTPPALDLPTPDDKALANEITFGLKPVPGKSEHFSRADHTHGTPPDLLPAHIAAPAAHSLLGDVSGTLNKTFIDLLQGQPVKATKPADGQYLKYVKDHWEPALVQGGTQGSFVLRPSKATDYAVSAAGIIEIDSRKPFAQETTPTYNGLKVSMFAPGKFGLEIAVVFNDYDLKKRYIVKLTPWVNPDSFPFIAWVVRIDPEGLRLGVGGISNFDFTVLGRLMVEICEFS